MSWLRATWRGRRTPVTLVRPKLAAADLVVLGLSELGRAVAMRRHSDEHEMQDHPESEHHGVHRVQPPQLLQPKLLSGRERIVRVTLGSLGHEFVKGCLSEPRLLESEEFCRQRLDKRRPATKSKAIGEAVATAPDHTQLVAVVLALLDVVQRGHLVEDAIDRGFLVLCDLLQRAVDGGEADETRTALTGTWTVHLALCERPCGPPQHRSRVAPPSHRLEGF
mmetsp:Transcript_4207/g.9127  ORF Transcript_4207/g.9127 Transcript_4207/m.9127 type:complete len:222 (+) Transcript_4207:232-897(+)